METIENLHQIALLLDPEILLSPPRLVAASKYTSPNTTLEVSFVVSVPPGEGVKQLPQWLIQAAQAEEDERLGRLRHGEFLIYPDGEDALGNRHVVTIWEKNGRRDSVYEDNVPNTPYGAAARAYFDAHPEPKPWHDAKPGEVWALELGWGGVNKAEPYTADKIEFRHWSSEMGLSFTDRDITGGRRIWPEDAS